MVVSPHETINQQLFFCSPCDVNGKGTELPSVATGVATANLFRALDTQLGTDVRGMERELRRKREVRWRSKGVERTGSESSSGFKGDVIP